MTAPNLPFLQMPPEPDEELPFDQEAAMQEVLGGVEGATGGGNIIELDGALEPTPDPIYGAGDEDEPDEAQLEQDRRSAVSAMYGADCPLLMEDPSEDDWGKWPEMLWDRHAAGKRKRWHLVQRNRLFRLGSQWLSSIRNGPWREPPKSINSSRFVFNMVAPALDQRVQIISEQRPGFKTRPVTQDTDDVKRAEAQQLAIEYQYDQQGMQYVIREASYWAGTDGVSFLHTYWDAEAGPWHEFMDGSHAPLGDPQTEVLRFEQVRVSANATANTKPNYWVVKRTIPMSLAVARYGEKAVKAGMNYSTSGEDADDAFGMGDISRHGLELPNYEELHNEQETVDLYMVYCEPSEYLPEGLTCISLGCYQVYQGPLTFGVVPIARYTDGSTDPSFFPKAIMEDWIEDQVLVNAIVSRWIDSVRRNAGGVLLARSKSIGTETMVGGLLSVIEMRGAGAIGDQVQPLQGMSVGNDAKELLSMAKKSFEDKSGWNESSRGSFQSAASGKAILAQREALERIFSEPVNAACRAMVQWGKINCHVMRWGYDIKRFVGVTGLHRSDLATAISAEDFDGIADVTIDAETMIPLPSSIRLFLLDQMFERGAIDVKEYRRRMPFGFVRSIETPDEDHRARAQRVADAIRTGRQPPPMLWMDDEAIHQDVLEREILLQDMDPNISAMAMQRWTELANQAMMKMGGMPMAQGAPQGGGTATQLSPTQQPLLANSPSISSAPAATLTGYNDERTSKALMDRSQPF